jgi:hypothetical protein
MLPQNFYRYGDKLYFHEPLNDGIYEVDVKNKTFEQCYALDIYGRSAPADFWTREYDSVMDIIQTATARGYCCGTPIFAESCHHLLFTYNEGGNKYPMCLYDKRTGESIQFENIVIGDGLPALSVAETTFYFGDDKMQFIVIPETYFWDENGKKYKFAVDDIVTPLVIVFLGSIIGAVVCTVFSKYTAPALIPLLVGCIGVYWYLICPAMKVGANWPIHMVAAGLAALAALGVLVYGVLESVKSEK